MKRAARVALFLSCPNKQTKCCHRSSPRIKCALVNLLADPTKPHLECNDKLIIHAFMQSLVYRHHSSTRRTVSFSDRLSIPKAIFHLFIARNASIIDFDDARSLDSDALAESALECIVSYITARWSGSMRGSSQVASREAGSDYTSHERCLSQVGFGMTWRTTHSHDIPAIGGG